MDRSGIDDKDLVILQLLKDDARLSYSELGEKVGLSRVAVKNRVAALEKRHIIRGYHAEVDLEKTPEMVPFFAEIMTDAPSFREIADSLKANEQVITLWETLGDCRLQAICLAKSRSDLSWFLKRFRDGQPGVKEVKIHDILNVLKGSILSK